MKNNTETFSSIVIDAGLILEGKGDWRLYLINNSAKISTKHLETLNTLLKLSNMEFDRFVGTLIKELQ